MILCLFYLEMEIEMENKPYNLYTNLKYYFSEINKFGKKTYVLLALAILSTTILTVISVVIPSYIINLLENDTQLTLVFYIVFGIMCFQAIMTYINIYNAGMSFLDRVGLRINHFMVQIYTKLTKMDYTYVEDPNKKLIYQNAVKNALESDNSGAESMILSITVFLGAIIQLICFGIMISILSGWIFLAVLITSFISAIGVKYIRDYRLKHKLYWSQLDMKSKYLTKCSVEITSGKDIRLYKMQDWFYNQMEDTNNTYINELKKIKILEFIVSVIERVLLFFRDYFVYIYLIKATIDGMNVAEFTLYFSIMSLFATLTKQIVEEAGKTIQAHQEINDLRRFYDIEDVNLGDEILTDDSELEIEFDNVSYRYIGASKDTITDLSFTIKAKEKLALVGVNGAGKTTIVKLMCGLLKPTKGRILVNGADLAEINQEYYYSLVAPVFQDSTILALPIRDNVCLSDNCDEVKLVDSLKRAGIYDKILSLENGLDQQMTKAIFDEGIELSGGETQKVMLARALYKEARLLILDEPTAALDALAESELYEQYADLIKGKTSMFISHRLSSTRFCDRIILLEQGKIIEMGNHDQLLKLDGKYAEMFEVQSQYYKEEYA